MASSIASRPIARSTTDIAAIALPLLLWMLAIVVAKPWGNFPLDDDWSFAITAHRLLDTGLYRPFGWTSMTLVGQSYWGALFCLPFGFSYTALRVSTLVAGALGLMAFALMLNELGCDRRKTIIATVLTGFNPLYFVLAGTFMTDVGFTVLCIAATLFFVRYLLARRATSFFWALVFSVGALSVRQLALYLPAAMLLTLLLDNRRNWRAIGVAFVSVIAGVALLKGYGLWLVAHHTVPSEYSAPADALDRWLVSPMLLLTKMEQALRAAIEQLGWYAFPLLMLRLPGLIRNWLRRPRGRLLLIGSLVAGLSWGAAMIVTHHMMPLNWTTVQSSGVGPIWLRDSRFAVDVAPLPAWFWMLVTMLSTTGGILLLLDLALTVLSLVNAWRARRMSAMHSVRAFLLFGACVYLAPLVLVGFYDRYLLPPIFMLVALVTINTQQREAAPRSARQASRMRLTLVASLAALVLMSGYSVAGLHDYLSWNRARWMLIDTLLGKGVPVTQIDGGYEFNGLYMYRPHYDYATLSDKSWWVHDDRYVVQFTQMSGYRVIDSANAGGWLPPLKTRVLVLERVGK